VAVCNEITLFLYYISSRLVTLLKITDAPIKVSDICHLTITLKYINCSFQIFLIFIPEMSNSCTSYNVCLCHMYKNMHLPVQRVSVCDTWLANMDFSTSSLQVLMPMQFCNNLLLSHHTFFHAVCSVVLPGECILLVCQSHFIYLKYEYLNLVP